MNSGIIVSLVSISDRIRLIIIVMLSVVLLGWLIVVDRLLLCVLFKRCISVIIGIWLVIVVIRMLVYIVLFVIIVVRVIYCSNSLRLSVRILKVLMWLFFIILRWCLWV